MLLHDYIVTLGLDGLKKYIGDKYNESQMRDAIHTYLRAQHDINFNCTREEEIDFGGVVEYLCKDFHEDIEQRLTGETGDIRGRAHKHIVAVACAYAQTHTTIQEKRVQKIVNDILNILRGFYVRKLTLELKLLAVRIADDVAQDTASQLEKQTGILLQAIKENVAPASLAHGTVRQLAQEGRLDMLGDVLTDFTETVSASHELKGYYGYEPKTVGGKQQFVSVPLSEEAEKLYPPHFKCNGRIYIDGHELETLTPQIIEYANNHQLTIRLVVEDACKFLGTYVDPQQCEAAEVIGAELLLPPAPFPEAMAYSLIIDDLTYYEYIMLRVGERFEDGTVLLTNEEQSIPFRIAVRANHLTNHVDLSFAITGGSNEEHLKYSRFLKAARANGRLVIHHLESGENLLEATCNECDSCEYMDRLDNDIAFLESLVALESFFEVKIEVPQQFTLEDVDLVHYVAAIIQGGEIRGTWSKYEASMTILPQTKGKLIAAMNKPYSLSYVGSATVNIFGQRLTYPCMRTLLSVKLEKPQKIAQLLAVLEEGDDLKIVFIPGERTGIGEYVDCLYQTARNSHISTT